MTYFNSYVFDNNDSNPSLHEEQLPAIAARSGFCWLFSHASTGSFTSENFHAKKKTTTTTVTKVKQFKFIVVNALFLAQSIPSENHTPCVGSIFFLSTNQKIELIDSPRGDYMATYRWQGAKMTLGLEIEDACDETMRGFRKKKMIKKR